MPWWIGTLIACTALGFMNAKMRLMDLTIKNTIILLPLMAVVIGGFWYGFKNTPHFTACWFFGAAGSALAGLVIGLLIFKEPMTARIWFGVLLTLAGSYLLAVH